MMSVKSLYSSILLISASLALSSPIYAAKAVKPGRIDPGLLEKITRPTTETKKTHFRTHTLAQMYTSWGVSEDATGSINLPAAWENFQKKKDIVVAVIDTGLDTNNSDLMENVYLPGVNANSEHFGRDFSKSRNDAMKPYDTNGHGTHIAGIIKSVFPDVKLMVLKYYDQNASGQDNLNSTIEALRFAVDNNADVINYSGGGPEPAIEELRILKEAERKGILVIAAAGNEESNIDNKKNAYYPASYGLTNIVTVTAHDQDVKILPSSNYGKNTVHISAPGNRIKSTHLYGRAGYLTGTSQATAFVSGVGAMLKAQYPQLNPSQIKEIIIKSAQKRPTLEDKCISGGLLDARNAQIVAAEVTGEAKKVEIREAKREVANKKGEGKIIYRLNR